MNFISKHRISEFRTLRTVRAFLLFSFLLALSFVYPPGSIAGEATLQTEPGFLTEMPEEYGRIIYHSNDEWSDRLFIIGMSHRDSLTRLNGQDSVDSQIEVYRIAEWLIGRTGLELLLPEGYFSESGPSDMGDHSGAADSGRDKLSYSTGKLRRVLENDEIYSNAEMLLMESKGVSSRQVEDSVLYGEVIDKIRRLEDSTLDMYESLYLRSSLDYLQDRRTAAMLQKVPLVLDAEFQQGKIKNKKAIMTIGLEHIDEIINYLNLSKIEIRSPAFSGYHDYISRLKLLDEHVGITVIIPKSLDKQGEVMRLTSL